MRRFTYRNEGTPTFWDRLVRTRAGLHVYWNIDVQGNRVVVELGPMGSEGLKRVHKFASEDEAHAECERMIRERLDEGYIEVTPRPPGPVRQALEDALAEDPDDLASHMAYADHLAELGDPRGEFIQAQLALENDRVPPQERERLRRREEELLAAYAHVWLGDLSPYLLDQSGVHRWDREHGRGYQYRFARGWIDSLRLYDYDPRLAAAFRANPLCRLLRRLVVVGSRHELDFRHMAESPYLANVRALQVGAEDEPTVSVNGKGAVALFERMPRLEELALYAFNLDVRTLFAMPLPGLRSLTVHHLTDYPLELLAGNESLGRLERMALFPHALRPEDDGAYLTLDGVRALVRSPHLTSLTDLELLASDLGDEGCAEVVRSGILKRLKVLSIALGRVTDEGARVLAACPDLRHLERLVVTGNQFTPAGVEALRATGIVVEDAGQFTAQQIADQEYLFEGDME